MLVRLVRAHRNRGHRSFSAPRRPRDSPAPCWPPAAAAAASRGHLGPLFWTPLRGSGRRLIWTLVHLEPGSGSADPPERRWRSGLAEVGRFWCRVDLGGSAGWCWTGSTPEGGCAYPEEGGLGVGGGGVHPPSSSFTGRFHVRGRRTVLVRARWTASLTGRPGGNWQEAEERGQRSCGTRTRTTPRSMTRTRPGTRPRSRTRTRPGTRTWTRAQSDLYI